MARRVNNWLQMDRERWTYEADRLDDVDRKYERQEVKDRAGAPICAMVKAGAMAPLFGGGEQGRALAEFMAEIEYDLEPGKMSGRPRTGADSAAPVQPDPTESNQMRRPVTRKIGIAGNAAPAGDGVAAIDIMRRLRSKRRTRMESPSESGSANLSPLHERRDFELPWLRGRGFQ